MLLLVRCNIQADGGTPWGGDEIVKLNQFRPHADRIPSWDAGVRGGIPNVPNSVDIRDFGATGDGQTDDTAALKAAIKAVSQPGAVYLPTGSYVIKGQIDVPSGIVIRGDGPNKTHILVTPGVGGATNTFAVMGGQGGAVALTRDAEIGTNKLTVTSIVPFKVGQTVEIEMDNQEFMGTVRFEAARGQMAKITAISNKTLSLDTQLDFDYFRNANARVYPTTPKQNVGFEDFHIKHVTSDGDKSRIFRFWHAENSWIKNVESEMAAKYHVEITRSRHITVQDSIFHHSYNYGGGGQGYGVLLYRHTSDCLIVNNTFYMLRHAILPTGGSGNVIVYNFSADGNSQEDQIGLADLNFHGGYSSRDLVEGNVVSRIKVGGSGTTGPYNILFRNRTTKEPYSKPTERYRAGIEIGNPSHYQTIIGNTSSGHIKITGFVRADLPPEPAYGLWIEKNLVLRDGVVANTEINTVFDNIFEPDQTHSGSLPESLYFSEKPDFWPDDLPWPAVGADIDSQRLSAGLPLYKIPAQNRYEHIIGAAPVLSPKTPTLEQKTESDSIQDTQAGFKCLRREAAHQLFPLQTINGWGFDVEILFLAQSKGLHIVEVPVNWYYKNLSQVRPIRDAYNMFREVLRVRLNDWQGRYESANAEPI